MENQTPDYERVGRFIYAFHRMGLSVAALTSATIPPELAARSNALAQRFDQIVKTSGNATDAEMVAVLNEADAVRALIGA
ncbi:hypothetical protein [Pseudoduganella sp. OTU4001]|uniref:hypothetical protein n=1 Tax=Pseudoduganella sp. OTU4001 TaxID=3043854 RepID=UPI00313D592F